MQMGWVHTWTVDTNSAGDSQESLIEVESLGYSTTLSSYLPLNCALERCCCRLKRAHAAAFDFMTDRISCRTPSTWFMRWCSPSTWSRREETCISSPSRISSFVVSTGSHSPLISLVRSMGILVSRALSGRWV